MKTRLLHFVEVLRSAFWLIPIIGLMSAVVLAVINIYIDRRVFGSDPELLSLLFYFNHQSSVQNLLATTASSVLGVAGVTFSITTASLTLLILTTSSIATIGFAKH